jgi:extracellular elastinolytic metalloproteinase
MHVHGWNPKSRPGRGLAGFVAVATVAALVGGGPAHGQPSGTAAPGVPREVNAHAHRDVDNRQGRAAPTARQVAAAGRVGTVGWNALGTPESVGPTAAPAAAPAADPVAAARRYLNANQDLYALGADAVAAMEPLLVKPIGAGTVVQLRQRFGNLPAGHDGLVSILLMGDRAVRVTSSLSRDTSAPQPATLNANKAVSAALADAGLTARQVERVDTRLVAVPMPADGPQAAYAVTLFSKSVAEPAAYTTYVDARTGGVLVREDLVNFDTDNPTWAVFPAAPPASIPPGTDPREIWCFTAKTGCVRQVRDPAGGQEWDLLLDQTPSAPSFTALGNSAWSQVNWAGTPVDATPRTDRNYVYPFTDQWRQARCNPTVFTSLERNDSDAAAANLFAMHNRMHDWSYHLGFTEATWNLQLVNFAPGGQAADLEVGRAQSGALTGSRNNANQATGPDGIAPISNMFLWQPMAGAAYPPCVDGSYDMTVIAHEYTHAITNRMIAGPTTAIGGTQGRSMGEGWSDLIASEYLFENNMRAPGGTPFVIGAYVTGNNANGIRSYDGSLSTLNYSNFGYDVLGPEVHADGEIWVAANLRVRREFVARYGEGTPVVQQSCADGLIEVASCPGNRRWVQLVFDSFLLQASGNPTMVGMRDNLLAADMARFGGANQDIIWKAFAESGLGQGATAAPENTDPTPSFASPMATNATITLRPIGLGTGAVVRLYVGDYEARSTPVADTDPATALSDTFQILPDIDFHFTVNGAGWGTQKFTTKFQPTTQELRVNVRPNLASAAMGATATGDGVNLDKLIDDTEATNWAAIDGVLGKRVTVDLTGDSPHLIKDIHVSTMTHPQIVGDVDVGPQVRLGTLRSFEILACDATQSDCASDAGYTTVYTSPQDAFSGGPYRPQSPELNLRAFPTSPFLATHLRFRVLTSQCTGNPLYAGEQDDDPRANTDCATASPFASHIRVAELQVFNPLPEIDP